MKKIKGVSFSLLLFFVAAILLPKTVVFGQATGGAVSLSGTRRIHVFTSGNVNGTVGLVQARTQDTLRNVKFTVVGAGGAGGGSTTGGGAKEGGGGGGGGVYDVPAPLIFGNAFWINETFNVLTIGAAGQGAISLPGGNGGYSEIQWGITNYFATGGSGGACASTATGGTSGGYGTRSTGSTGTPTAINGVSGGTGVAAYAGGGGGANGIGTPGVGGGTKTAGNGGAADTSLANNVLYGAGGGGGGAGGSTGAAGGSSGIGGSGRTSLATPTSPPAANSGSGGGGESGQANGIGAAGSSGIVVVSYDAYDLYTAGAGAYNSSGYVNGGQTAGLKKKFVTSGTITFGSSVNFGTDVLVVESGTTLLIDGASTVLTCGTLYVYGSISTTNSGTISSSRIIMMNTSGSQSIPAGNYTNLECRNTSGTNTVSGNITVSGTLTVAAGGTLSMGSRTLTLSLSNTTITNDGTITTTAVAPFSDSRTGTKSFGSVTYANSAGGQTIAGGSYGNLTFSNSSGTNTAAGNITTSAIVLIPVGSTMDMSTFTLNAQSINSVSGSVLRTSCTTNPPISSTNTSTFSGTIIYEAASKQYVGSAGVTVTVNNLELSGGSAVVHELIGNFTVTGSYKRNNGTTLDQKTFTLTLPGGSHPLDDFNTSTTPAGSYHDVIFSYVGNTSVTGNVIISGKLKVNSGTKVQIGSGGNLIVSGILPASDIHEVIGSIELNGGNLVITGSKDQRSSQSPAVLPFMIVKNDILDVSTSGTAGCIQFTPGNSSSSGVGNKRSVIRFVGSSLNLGHSSTPDNSITTNENAYFEIGDSNTTTSLTVNDNFTILNGLRLRSGSTLVTNGKVKLGTTSTKKFGGSSYVGYIDTIDATGTTPVITGNITLVETMTGGSGFRKYRFLGNPFKYNLAITDFTDNIDITGSITSTNANNFTSTTLNNPSAFTYSESSNSWSALTSGGTASSLATLQGMRVMVRGVKGEGLDGTAYVPSVAQIEISGEPYIGDKTIDLAYTGISNGYNFITNPFLSPVNFNLLTLTNVSDVISVYVPGESGYKTYDKGTNAWSGSNQSAKGEFWLPGTAVFFKATGINPSVLVEDHDKVNPTLKSYAVFYEELDTLNNIAQIFVGHSNDRLSLSDGVVLDFGSAKAATDLYDNNWDADDFGSDSVNLSLITPEGKYLAISKTNALADNETRRYPLSLAIRDNSLNGKYTLRFEQFKAFESGMKVILLDKLNNVSTDLLSMPQYQFDVTADANSKGSGRFEIVVSKAQLSINDIVNKKSVDFIVNQNTQLNTTEFSFTGSTNNNQLTILDAQGKMVKTFDNFQSSVSVPNNQMKPGVYFAQVQSGDMKHTKKFIVLN